MLPRKSRSKMPGVKKKRSSEKLAGGTIEIQYLEKTVGALWTKVRRRGANQMRALFAPKVLARQVEYNTASLS